MSYISSPMLETGYLPRLIDFGSVIPSQNSWHESDIDDRPSRKQIGTYQKVLQIHVFLYQVPEG